MFGCPQLLYFVLLVKIGLNCVLSLIQNIRFFTTSPPDKAIKNRSNLFFSDKRFGCPRLFFAKDGEEWFKSVHNLKGEWMLNRSRLAHEEVYNQIIELGLSA